MSDSMTGNTIYGYVMDSCADDNFWCQNDVNHLDISKSYLTAMGYVSKWNGRKVSWKYMTDTPSGFAPAPPFPACASCADCLWCEVCTCSLGISGSLLRMLVSCM